jgi:hypothetical protein
MGVLLVCDTSVLIDLHRGAILGPCFRLPFRIAVPDLLFEREIRTWDGPDVVALGLEVLTLDGVGVALAQACRVDEPRLSLPDVYALALAKTGGHVLLAGDRNLRASGEREGVECHGVLWVLDQLEEHAVVTHDTLYASLMAITSHPRCRLPQDEVERRLDRWAGQQGA